MSHFKPGQFEVKEEGEQPAEARVVKFDLPVEPVVTQFQFGKIKRSGEGDYAAVKAKYGALAATDAERKAKTRKDSRFTLNPLLRDPLSVEEEERRVIDEKVRERVEALAADAKAKAAELGYQEGLKRGHEEAFKKFQAEGAERIARLEGLIAGMEGAKDEIFRANERFLIEMIFRIARMVLLKDLSSEKDYLLRLARELLERVGVRDNVTIRISPEDSATIGMLKEGLESALGAMKNLNIEPSSQVRGGGCVIETEWNAIDASIETQLQGIYKALIGQGPGGSAT